MCLFIYLFFPLHRSKVIDYNPKLLIITVSNASEMTCDDPLLLINAAYLSHLRLFQEEAK